MQMNNVPVLSMTLTGGLWFGAGVTDKLFLEIRFGLLLFSGLCNIAFILAALRIRDVFHSYLEKIEEFNPNSFCTGKPKKPTTGKLGSYSMISIYCTLMGIGGIFSFLGAHIFYWPFGFPKWCGGATIIIILLMGYCILFSRNELLIDA